MIIRGLATFATQRWRCHGNTDNRRGASDCGTITVPPVCWPPTSRRQPQFPARPSTAERPVPPFPGQGIPEFRQLGHARGVVSAGVVDHVYEVYLHAQVTQQLRQPAGVFGRGVHPADGDIGDGRPLPRGLDVAPDLRKQLVQAPTIFDGHQQGPFG